MRVLHLNTHPSGGSFEYAMLLSTALAEQGIESRVLCKNFSSQQEVRRPLLDRIIRRAYVSLSTEPWHGTRRLMSAPTTAELDQIDVVHLHTVADWFNVPDWLERLPRRMGVVISIHDMWHISGGCFVYRGCDRFANETRPCDACPLLIWPANRLLANTAYARKVDAYRNCGARLVANSVWLAQLADQSAIARVCGGTRVIPPGIDSTVFKLRDKELCRMRLGLPADAFVIVTGAASLNDANKNLPWLLEQLSNLPDLGKVIVLVFGEGFVAVPDRLNVRFAGPIRDRCGLAQLLAAADVFVSASLMETYGLTLIEAMACGTPVVALKVGGIPEAAPDGQGAILCKPKDGAAILEAITMLRESRETREQLASIGYERVHRCNAASSFGSEFAHIYRESLSPNRTAPAAVAAISA
jgi:glycosyltransferase involved in cell wall biosynthesis